MSSTGNDNCRLIILALIESRPEPGPEQAALIASIQYIINELLSRGGLGTERITDAYGTDLLNICIAHFPELFDIIFENTKSILPASTRDGFFRTRRESQYELLLRGRDGSYQGQVRFDPSVNASLYAAIIMSNKDQWSSDGESCIGQKTLRQYIIRKLVDHQKGNLNQSEAAESGLMPPLMLAAVLGDTETIKYLLSKEASIDLIWHEHTALIYALQYNREETVMTLLEHGAQFINDKRFSEEAKKLEKIQEKMREMLVNVAGKVKKDEPFMLPNGYHLVEISVIGDGDCLYHAVSLHDDHGRTASDLREMVADYIGEGNLSGFVEDPISYAARVRSGLWGGEREIRALMHILGRPIVVMHQNGLAPTRYDTTPALSGEPLFVSYNGTDHYNGLVPASGYTAREIYSTHLPIIQLLHQDLWPDIIYSVLSYLPIAEVFSKLNLEHLNPKKSEGSSPLMFKGTSVKRKTDELQEEDENTQQIKKRA